MEEVAAVAPAAAAASGPGAPVDPAQIAQELSAHLNGSAANFYKYPPAAQKEMMKIVRNADWKTLVALAPGSDVWKIKKRYYTLKKASKAKRSYKKRSYGRFRKTAFKMARPRFRSRVRYRPYSRGFRRRRSFR